MVTTVPIMITLIKKNLKKAYAKFEHLPGQKFYEKHEIHDQILAKMNEISGEEKKIVDEPIIVKIYGKDMTNLTLIDLPGITINNTDEQNQNTSDDILKLVSNYIKKESTIILAISPGTDDIANSVALKYARQFDPNRERTIGVVTKVDLMNEGTDASEYLKNKKIALKYGYTCVRCRSPKDVQDGVSIEQAIKNEKNFFDRNEAYNSLEEEQGIPVLRKKLSKIYSEHIKKQCPEIKDKIKQNLKISNAKKAKLGPELIIDTPHDQKKAVLQMITNFSSRLKEVVLHGYKEENTEFGGVVILDIIKYFMFSSVVKVDPINDLSDEAIVDEIRITNGNRPELFVPEEVCRGPIQRGMDDYKAPIQECLDSVAYIVHECILNLCIEHFSSCTNLQKLVYDLMAKLVNGEYESGKSLIFSMVDAEKSFINYLDHDFLQLKKYLLSEDDLEDHKYEYLKRRFGIKKEYFIKCVPKAPQPIAEEDKFERISTHSNSSEEINNFYTNQNFFEGENFEDLTKHSKSKFHQINDLVWRNNKMKFVNLQNPINRILKESKSIQSRDQVDPIDTQTITYGSAGSPQVVLEPISIKEDDKKIRTIKKVINGYFSCVTKHFQSNVPKYITKYLIDNVIEKMESSLLLETLEVEDLRTLLEENPETIEARSTVNRNIEMLEIALASIERIESQSDYANPN